MASATGQGEGLLVLGGFVGDGLSAQQGGKFERGAAAAFWHVAQGHRDGARAGKGIPTPLSFVTDCSRCPGSKNISSSETILFCFAQVGFNQLKKNKLTGAEYVLM